MTYELPKRYITERDLEAVMSEAFMQFDRYILDYSKAHVSRKEVLEGLEKVSYELKKRLKTFEGEKKSVGNLQTSSLKPSTGAQSDPAPYRERKVSVDSLRSQDHLKQMAQF